MDVETHLNKAQRSQPSATSLYLLNRFEFDSTVPFRTEKVKALLAYLVVEGDQSHYRTTLATLLWSDLLEKRARSNLRLAVHNLRHVLEGVKPLLLLETSRSQLRLHTQPDLFVDSIEFERLLDEADSAELQQHSRQNPTTQQHLLQSAIDLYQGEFCRGLHIRDAIVFEEWLLLKQEQLHQRAVGALQRLLDLLRENGDYVHLQRYGARLIELMPLQEDGYLAQIEAFALNHDEAGAQATFDTYRTRLQRELGEEPSQRMVAALAQLNGTPVALPVQTGQKPINLPASTTPFFGRKADLAHLTEWLTSKQYRLITLVGMGGIGKTRLALEVARANVEDFADGTFFVRLSGLDAIYPDRLEAQIAEAIADAVNLKLQGNQPAKTQLLEWLRPRNVLLVLDNWEQVIDGADIVGDLLTSSADLTIICTSQIVLNFQMERIFEVEGLPVPALDAENAAEYDSIRLFWERAERFVTLSDSQLPEVIALADFVEGHPLALELAAAALREENLSSLIDGLEQSAESLAVTFRDMPRRQRSIRALFDRTWGLLNKDEQAVLCALSVMRGQFSETAAIEVGNTSLEALYELYDKSLLQRVSAEYFTLHSLTTQYAQSRLQLDNEKWLTAIDTHHTYYLSWLAAAHQPMLLEGGTAVVQQLNAEYDNIRFAWINSMRAGKSALIVEAALSLSELLLADTRLHEGAYLFGLSYEGDIFESRSALIAMGWLYSLRAHFQFQLGAMTLAESLFDEALAVAEELHDPRLLLQTLHMSNDFHITHTDGENLAEQLNRTEALAREQNNFSILGLTTQYRGAVHTRAGEFEQALPFLREAEEVAIANQLTTLLLESYAWQAHVLEKLERWPEFLRVTDAALKLAERKQEKLFKTSILTSLAHYHEKQGDLLKAITLLGKCVEEAHKLDHAKLLLVSYIHRADLLTQLERYTEAIADYQMIYQLYGQHDDERVCRALAEIGRIHTITHNHTAARTTYEQLLSLARHFGRNDYIKIAQEALQ